MTFSLAARCRRTGMFGVAITTASIAVGARCPFVRAGVGVVLTQNRTDPRLGPIGLDFLAKGMSARSTIDELARIAHVPGWRQLAAIDCAGQTAHFSGGSIVSKHGGYEGPDCVSIGNLLVSDELPRKMVDGFARRPDRHIAQRLINSLMAGIEAGGETNPVRSATLLVADKMPFPEINLRVDDHDEPVGELQRLWTLYEPQIPNYLLRVHAPDDAV